MTEWLNNSNIHFSNSSPMWAFLSEDQCLFLLSPRSVTGSTWSSPGKLGKWYEEEAECLEGLIWIESHKGQGSRRKNSHRPEVLGPLLLSASFVTLSAFLWAPDSLRAQWEPSPGRALCCLAILKPSGYTQMQRHPSLPPACPLLRVGTGGKEEWQAHQERITEGNE